MIRAWLGVDAPELTRQRLARDLGQRPGHLDARGAAADDDERHPFATARGIGLALGHLVGQEHAAADLERVLDALEAGGERRPAVVAEVRVGGAGREHQVVVGELAVLEHERLGRDVDRHRLRQQHRDVRPPAEHAPDRGRDVGGVQGGRGHLVEEGLEEVVVPPVHDGHLRGGALEGLGGVQPAETAADDDDLGPGAAHESSLTLADRGTRGARQGLAGRTARGLPAT